MNESRSEPTLQVMPPLDQAPAEAEVELDQRAATAPRSRRRRRARWVLVLLAICAAVALWSIVWQPQTVSQLPLAPATPPAPTVEAPSGARYPIESTAASLPPLDGSDATVLAALTALFSNGKLGSLIEPRDLVRNIVVTVDNLPRKALPSQRLPIRPVAGSFGTASANGGLVVGETNAQRYAPYVRLLESVDPTRLVQVYVGFYPLFQQAYRELGYPNGHFNDRLVEAIDVLLATPEAPATLAVVQPKIFYEFADPQLEQLPAGQKLMLRIGPDNAARVQERLREIRALLVAHGADAAALPSPLSTGALPSPLSTGALPAR
jgi:hypothetical protein